MPAALALGGLNLFAPPSSRAPYRFDAKTSDTDWGNPDATTVSIASMLSDGDRGQITRYGNRTATVEIIIEGTSLDEVAKGEALLMTQVNLGRNTLKWTPPGTSTPSVFDVIYSDIQFRFDDFAENVARRRFVLVLICLPFARRETLTTQAATPTASPTLTLIDDCTATTGWTGSSAVTVVSGAVRVTNTTLTRTLTRTGLSVAFANEYLVLDVDCGPTTTYPQEFQINGATVNPYARIPSSATRATWYIPFNGTLTGLQVSAFADTNPLQIFDVSKATSIPSFGSLQQWGFKVTIAGTARTPVDFIIDSGFSTNIAPEMLVYTAPSKPGTVLPVLRPMIFSSATPSTATTWGSPVSGYWHDFSSITRINIPANIVPPATYLLMARLRLTSGSANTTMDWSADTNSDFTPVVGTVSGSTIVALDTTWKTVPLATLTLPTVAVTPGSHADVEITLDTVSTTAIVDEIYLFNLDAGQLTHIGPLPAATAIGRFVVRAASLDTGQPSWLMGTSTATDPDNAMDASAYLQSAGVHTVPPGPVDILLVTPGTTAAGATLTAQYYARYRHNVPPPGF